MKQIRLPHRYSAWVGYFNILLSAVVWPQFAAKVTTCTGYMFVKVVNYLL